jgi:hypothetical protein
MVEAASASSSTARSRAASRRDREDADPSLLRDAVHAGGVGEGGKADLADVAAGQARLPAAPGSDCR